MLDFLISPQPTAYVSLARVRAVSGQQVAYLAPLVLASAVISTVLPVFFFLLFPITQKIIHKSYTNALKNYATTYLQTYVGSL